MFDADNTPTQTSILVPTALVAGGATLNHAEAIVVSGCSPSACAATSIR